MRTLSFSQRIAALEEANVNGALQDVLDGIECDLLRVEGIRVDHYRRNGALEPGIRAAAPQEEAA